MFIIQTKNYQLIEYSKRKIDNLNLNKRRKETKINKVKI